MEKLKELWTRLDVKYAAIGGAIVISTSLGTCHFTGSSEESVEPAPESAPEVQEPFGAPEKPAEEAEPEEIAE